MRSITPEDNVTLMEVEVFLNPPETVCQLLCYMCILSGEESNFEELLRSLGLQYVKKSF
jgi:hypothetical protein